MDGLKNDIDLIIANDKTIFKNESVLNKFNAGSGYKLVRTHIKYIRRKKDLKL